MTTPTFYIRTCDKSAWILQTTSYLLNKYWGYHQRFVILGFAQPGFDLPDNFEFVSMGTDPGNANNWSSPMHQYFKSIDDDYVILSQDDFLPLDQKDDQVFFYLLGHLKKDTTIGRLNLGFGPSLRTERYNVIETFEGWELYQLNQTAPYRVTTQTSVWRKDYLLKFLEGQINPWQFELQGSQKAINDGTRILGTRGRFAFRWSGHSALSNRWPGKVNILGQRVSVLKNLINLGFLQPQQLQYGLDNAPQFSDIGYDFNIELLKPHCSPEKYQDYLVEYGNYYK